MNQRDLTIPDEQTSHIKLSTVRKSICDKENHPSQSTQLTYQFTLASPSNSISALVPFKPKSTNVLTSNAQKHPKEIPCCSSKALFKFQITPEIKYQLKEIKQVFKEIKSVAQVSNPLYHYPPRKTILLDLDDTIAHTVPLNKKGLHIYSCTPLKGKMSRYAVIKRPYLDIFLSMLSKHYDIMIYSAAEKDYINMVIKALNIEKFLNPLVFSREHCTILSNGIAIKNLQVLAKNVEDIILVDNSICSFFVYPKNGIYVLPFIGNDKDIELLRLGQFLVTFHGSENLSSSLYNAGYNLIDLFKKIVCL